MTKDKGQMTKDPLSVALGVVVVALVAALFHFFGVTDSGYDPATATRSLFVWLSRRWGGYSETQDDFPYGWAAPLVSLWMVWRLRRELAAEAKRVSIPALAVVVCALLLHWTGARTQQTRISFVAFIVLVWAIPFHLYGWRVARMLVVPAGFLCFMLQLDFLSGLALKFRQMQAAGAVLLLDGLGMNVERDGLALRIGPDVCDAGSAAGGLRSLLLVGAVAVVLAWLRQRGPVRQLLLLAAVPLVVLIAAMMRLTVLGFLISEYTVESVDARDLWITAGFYLAAFALLLAWHRVLRSPKLFHFAKPAHPEDA